VNDCASAITGSSSPMSSVSMTSRWIPAAELAQLERDTLIPAA
jgi:hypothetical protein